MQNTFLITKENIMDKIYIVRGEKVMIDSDLASIYGYTTKTFNQQVKNNIEKFDPDFMFQLTMEEAKIVSRSKILTLDNINKRGTNIKYLPYAFTEQGIYMLMTVLKGDLATRQTKAITAITEIEAKMYIMNLLINYM